MDFISIFGYSVLTIYLLLGLVAAIHVFALRIEYHDRYKRLVSEEKLIVKYPSGIDWLDSQNHWMIKDFRSCEDAELKKIGELLMQLLPFVPPPQNLLLPLVYPKWLKRNWSNF